MDATRADGSGYWVLLPRQLVTGGAELAPSDGPPPSRLPKVERHIIVVERQKRKFVPCRAIAPRHWLERLAENCCFLCEAAHNG